MKIVILLLCSIFTHSALAEKDKIKISPELPSDISGGAPNASLKQAAMFAWQQFIALNWPALPDQRDTADQNARFGDSTGALVWHTFRHKVEIYPGQGNPPGFVNDAQMDFGYNHPPEYIYGTGIGVEGKGIVKACPGQHPVDQPAYINLDELSQIGLAQMFAGVAPTEVEGNSDPQLFRYLAKANKQHYKYVTNPNAVTLNGVSLFSHDCSNNPGDTYCTAVDNFTVVAKGNGAVTEIPGFVVDFPFGSIEVKSAWRELTPREKLSGRFYQTTVRFYEATEQAGEKLTCYREAEWGMIGLHMEQKIPSLGLFVYTTFEQADALLTEHGRRVENSVGKVIDQRVRKGEATEPVIDYTDGDPPVISAEGPACANPGKRLFYQEQEGGPQEVEGLPLPFMDICQNRRERVLPNTIMNVNKQAHRSIENYNEQHRIFNSPWKYYKLVNIQYRPFDKSAIVYNANKDNNPATFYLNNIVIETDYTLQNFSGRLGSGPPTDMPANFNAFNNRTTYQNVLVFDDSTTSVGQGSVLQDTYNMGGCMGCHGNAQLLGTDFSFILNDGRVALPEYPGIPPGTSNPPPLER